LVCLLPVLQENLSVYRYLISLPSYKANLGLNHLEVGVKVEVVAVVSTLELLVLPSLLFHGLAENEQAAKL